LFFYILSLAGLRSFGDCFAEEGEEFAHAKRRVSDMRA